MSVQGISQRETLASETKHQCDSEIEGKKTEESRIIELSSNISTSGKPSLTNLPKRAKDLLFGLL